jgi:pimeloyl-ACP methyl ester carboxylesterase
VVVRRVLVLLACAACLAAAPALAASPQTVSLRTEDGITILGTLYLPARPGPGVILLHMQTRSREDWQAVAAHLADAGFAALAIDFRGSGASDPAPPGSDPQDYSRWTLDAKAARAYLASRSDVVQGRVGVAGASIGANIAALFAAADPSVRSLALLSAGLDYRGVRIEAAMGKLTGRSALLVASEEDSYAANSARRLAKQAGGTRELRLLTGAGHGTVMLSRQTDLAGALVDWFRRTLL